MRLYNYTGEVSENLLVVNTADIKFEEVFNSFSHSGLPQKEVSLCKSIILKSTRQDADKSITMSDDRLVYVANKLMVKYPEHMLHTGLNEWVIVYEFLKRFYDKSLPSIDKVIRAVNLYIGKSFTDKGAMSGKEFRELTGLSGDVSSVMAEYSNVIPKFVIDALSEKFVADKTQTKLIEQVEIDDAFSEFLNVI